MGPGEMSRQSTRRPNKRVAVKSAPSAVADSNHPAQSQSSGNPKRIASRRLVFLVFTACTLLVIGLVTDSPAKVCHAFATRAIHQFDDQKALLWIERARMVSSQNETTELLAARVARSRGDLSEAAECLKRAQRFGANRDDIRLEQLLGSAQTGSLDGIEAELVGQLQNPRNDGAEISLAYANGLAMATRFEDAFSVLEAWGDDYPDDPRAPYRSGRLREHLEQWEEAEADYRRALARRADFYPASYALGRVLLTGRRVDEAAEAFRACLAMPQPQAAQIELAACYRAKGDPEKARQALREVLASDYETILESYRAVQDIPDYFEAAVSLGDLEAEAGNSTQAVEWFKLAIDKNPRDLTARYGMALALRELGRTEEAQKEFDHVLEVRKALERANPLRDRIATRRDDLEARLELGELLLEYESEKMGLFWIRSVFTYDRMYAPAHRALAKYFRGLPGKSSDNLALAQYHEQAASENTQQ